MDTDYDGWVLADGTWDEPRMDRFLREHPEAFVSGAVENQRRFYDRFEHVVLFNAPAAVILERIAARSNNPYGKSAQERDEIMENLRTVEPCYEAARPWSWTHGWGVGGRTGAAAAATATRHRASVVTLTRADLPGRRRRG